MRELPHPVGKPRCRPRVIAIAVDGNRPARPLDPVGARGGIFGAEAARPDDDELRLEREHLSQVVACDGSPNLPSTSTPPASSIISGSQCPAQNGGSSHSAKNARGGGSPRTAEETRSTVSSIRAAISSPRSKAPSFPASRRTESTTSPNVRGSSETTSAPTGHADASSPLDTAQTAQRS